MVADAVASNIRAYRQLRGFEQDALARRMASLGFKWRRPTVSEVERRNRDVTVAELFGLTAALGTTIENLIDTRGPEGRRGPDLLISDRPPLPDGPVLDGQVVEPFDRRLVLPPGSVSALVCPHRLYAEAEWSGHVFTSMLIQHVEDDAS
jgi:transcriptional regulator with XRE-family HTH domain